MHSALPMFLQQVPFPTVAYQSGQEPVVFIQAQSTQMVPPFQRPEGASDSLNKSNTDCGTPSMECVVAENIVASCSAAGAVCSDSSGPFSPVLEMLGKSEICSDARSGWVF